MAPARRMSCSYMHRKSQKSPDAREECWLVYYGDVHAGTIAIRSGNPTDTTG
jgi:hypothetical protein